MADAAKQLLPEGCLLLAGIGCVDVVSTCSAYPDEDSSVRASARVTRPGGNSVNSALVAAQLGAPVAWFGCLGDDWAAVLIESRLQRAGVHVGAAVRHEGAESPASHIVVSPPDCRTIVHWNPLAELSAEDWRRLPLHAGVRWLHAESRNLAVTMPALTAIAAEWPALKLSMEWEKQRAEDVQPMAAVLDCILLSRAFARAVLHVDSKEAAVAAVRKLAKPGAVIVCAWGSDGAAAVRAEEGAAVLSCAAVEVKAEEIVDATAAGDCFNAAVLVELMRGEMELDEVLRNACQLAARSLMLPGVERLCE